MKSEAMASFHGLGHNAGQKNEESNCFRGKRKGPGLPNEISKNQKWSSDRVNTISFVKKQQAEFNKPLHCPEKPQGGEAKK